MVSLLTDFHALCSCTFHPYDLLPHFPLLHFQRPQFYLYSTISVRTVYEQNTINFGVCVFFLFVIRNNIHALPQLFWSFHLHCMHPLIVSNICWSRIFIPPPFKFLSSIVLHSPFPDHPHLSPAVWQRQPKVAQIRVHNNLAYQTLNPILTLTLLLNRRQQWPFN